MFMTYRIFFLGPFTPTLSRSRAVDFTSTIHVSGYYATVVPLKFQDNLLSLTDPLSQYVWICFLISIPTMVGFMCMANYVFTGCSDWEASLSFVLRNALSEHINMLPDKHMYQRLLIAIWSWVTLVIITAYAGNLTAIITTPALNIPFTNAEAMLRQTQIKWAVWDKSLFARYANERPQENLLKKLVTGAIPLSKDDQWADNCYTTQAKESGNIAAICDITSAKFVVSSDFSKTGTCNYYLTTDKVLASGNVLAFQVREMWIYLALFQFNSFPEGKPLLKRC